MKAILEFNLPEDQEEYQIHSNASKLHDVLWRYDQELSRLIKDDKPLDAQGCRDLLWKHIRDNEVHLLY